MSAPFIAMPAAPKEELLLPKATPMGAVFKKSRTWLVYVVPSVGAPVTVLPCPVLVPVNKSADPLECSRPSMVVPVQPPNMPMSSAKLAVPSELYNPHSTVFWVTPVMPPEAENLKVTTAEALACDKTIGVKLLVMKNIRVLAGTVKVTLVADATSPPVATLALTRLPLVSYELHCICPQTIPAEPNNDSAISRTEFILE